MKGKRLVCFAIFLSLPDLKQTMDFSQPEILLSEIQQGNQRAFEFLFKSYYPRLRHFAARFVDETTAEDITQECFLKIWEMRSEIRNPNIASLLFTMVRNACLNHLKHIALVDISSIEFLENLQGDERLYAKDFASNTDYSCLYNDLKSQVEKVMDTLPQRCREVFVLSRMNGLKNKEIADQLNISTTMVEKHIAKAVSIFSSQINGK